MGIKKLIYDEELVKSCKLALQKGIINAGNIQIALQEGKLTIQEAVEILNK